MPNVTPEMVELALSCLSVEASLKLAKAKADEVRAEEAKKQTLARLKRECPSEKANVAREDWARCHPDYQQAVDRYAQAVEAAEAAKAATRGAETILSVWQSENRMQREAERVR